MNPVVLDVTDAERLYTGKTVRFSGRASGLQTLTVREVTRGSVDSHSYSDYLYLLIPEKICGKPNDRAVGIPVCEGDQIEVVNDNKS